jgi:hypothetical protein
MNLEGDIINNLYEAYLWLLESWQYEPYNISYISNGKRDYENFKEYIDIESDDEDCLDGWIICSLEEFKEFIEKH